MSKNLTPEQWAIVISPDILADYVAEQTASLRSQIETLKEALARAGTMMVAAAHDVEFHGFKKLATQMREEADEARAALETKDPA